MEPSVFIFVDVGHSERFVWSAAGCLSLMWGDEEWEGAPYRRRMSAKMSVKTIGSISWRVMFWDGVEEKNEGGFGAGVRGRFSGYLERLGRCLVGSVSVV